MEAAAVTANAQPPLAKRIKALQKKIKQVDDLLERIADGYEANEEQISKINRRSEWASELASLSS